MSFDIEQIKINLFTNIKDEKLRTIELTKSMLYHPEMEGITDVLNEYPYFTFDVKYPLNRLRYLTYKERIEFFFNKEKFRERLEAYSSKEKNILRKGSQSDEEQTQYFKQRDRNIEKNIMTMIEILFPTNFPVINDIQTSYEIIQEKSKLRRMVINPIITQYYSYLKLDGETYTFKKLIWMNDILNHPKYQRLISEYRKLLEWADDEKFRQMRTMNRSYEEIQKLLVELYNNLKKFTPTATNYFSIGDVQNNIPLIVELFKLSGIEIQSEEVDNFCKYKTVQTFTKDQKCSDNIGLIDLNIGLFEKYSTIKDNIEELTKFVKEGKGNLVKFLSNNTKLFTSNKDTEQFIIAVKKYEQVENLFTKTFDEITKEYGQTLPAEYRNFAYTVLSEYRKPLRESTNTELQELINGSDSKSIDEFFKFMNYIYKKYVYIVGREQSNEHYNKLLNIGMNNINTNTTTGVRREVYIYADFIKGEVNKDNAGKIFCPFVGDHLGNEFEFLVRMAMYGKTGSKDTRRWNIDRNRMIFVIKNSSSESGKQEGKPMELKATPLGTSTSDNLLVPSKTNLDRLGTYFLSEIVGKDKEIVESMNRANRYIGSVQLYDQELLNYIKKNEPELYSVIEDWNEDIQKRNQKVLDKMITLLGKYKTDIDKIQSSRLVYEVNRNQQELNKADYNIEKIKIFIAVLNRLIESEKSKIQEFKGGSRKHFNQVSKNTQFSLQKHIRRYTRRLISST